MSQKSFTARSVLVLSLGCYAGLGCGGDDTGNPQVAGSGGNASGSPSAIAGNAGKGGTQSVAGASSGGSQGGNLSGGGTAGSSSAGAGPPGGSAGGGQSNGGNGPGGAGGAPEPTDGCQEPSKPATGKQSVDVGGTDRSYYLVASEVVEPVPLFIGFHGYGGNGEADQYTFNLQSRADGKGVFMFPDGVVQTWYQDALGWDNRNNDNPDMTFVKALIAEAKSKHCIDTSRIYVMGFSWGGWMATQVACALGDQLRAMATVAGGGPMNDANCKATSALIMHGTNDGSENISSGRTSRDHFVDLGACESTTTPVVDAHCVSHAGCQLPVWWCEHGGGHEIPGDWGQDAVWDFFQSAPAH
jgi:polyhydroxybutyrate depolymerase